MNKNIAIETLIYESLNLRESTISASIYQAVESIEDFDGNWSREFRKKFKSIFKYQGWYDSITEAFEKIAQYDPNAKVMFYVLDRFNDQLNIEDIADKVMEKIVNDKVDNLNWSNILAKVSDIEE